MSGLLPYLYMAAYIAIGWRLYALRWQTGMKIAAGAAMVIAPPLLFILPALRHREGATAGLLLATGVGMLVMGLLCALGGMVASYLRERSRPKR